MGQGEGKTGEINKGIIEENFSELRDVWIFKIEKIHLMPNLVDKNRSKPSIEMWSFRRGERNSYKFLERKNRLHIKKQE